jgi:hypothetical protein
MAQILVWFGLYICPDKPKPIYGYSWAKEKGMGKGEIEVWSGRGRCSV